MTDIIWILILCQNDVCDIFVLFSLLCDGWTLWNSTSIYVFVMVLFSHLNICSYQEKLRGILLKLKIEYAQWSSFMIKVFAFKLLYLFLWAILFPDIVLYTKYFSSSFKNCYSNKITFLLARLQLIILIYSFYRDI